nr:hypothetical protein [Tanacetum cinerariifolium]
MKRIGKGLSGKETPLFPTMVGPNQVQIGEGSPQPTDTQHTPTFDMLPPKPKKTQKPRQPKRKTTKVPHLSKPTDIAADEAVYKTQTKATSNELSSQGTSSGDGPMRQDTMRDTSAHTRYERVSKMSSDLMFAGVNTSQSDDDRLKDIELIKIYTTLQKKFLKIEDELKMTKTSQQTKIDSLERRVKKLEKKHMSRTHKLKRLYKVGLTAKVISSSDDEALDKEDISKQGRIDVIDTNEDIALMLIDTAVDDVQVTTTITEILVSAAETILTTASTITAQSTKINVEVTQAPKRKGVMIQEPEETTTTKTPSSQQPQVQDKGKGKEKLIEEPEMPKKIKHQIKAANELAKKLRDEMQSEINEENRLAREIAQK